MIRFQGYSFIVYPGDGVFRRIQPLTVYLTCLNCPGPDVRGVFDLPVLLESDEGFFCFDRSGIIAGMDEVG